MKSGSSIIDNKKIFGILACTKSGAIGLNQSISWDYPEELNHFRSVTNNKDIIMGRKTYDSVPSALMKRTRAIVLSHNVNLQLDNAKVVHSLSECLNYIKNLSGNEIYMIGGAEISHLFLDNNLIDNFILSIINQEYPGDTYLDLSKIKYKNKIIMQENDDYTIYNLSIL